MTSKLNLYKLKPKDAKITHSKVAYISMVALALLLSACGQEDTVVQNNESIAVSETQTDNTITTVANADTSLNSDMTTMDMITTNSSASDLATTVNYNPATQANILQGVSATVYKSPTCGCCGSWIEHAEQAGMHTIIEHPENLSAIKAGYGIPVQVQSCHTAVTEDGYVFEGHIPARYIADFLANPPTGAIGLAVAGMPVGSPGMEYDDKFMAYDVLQINTDGSTSVFVRVISPEQQTLTS